MKTLGYIFTILMLVISASAYAECVGIAKEKYCLGKPPPNKSASMMDDGIYIRKPSDKEQYSNTYGYEDEIDEEIGLPILASASIHKNKIVSLTQSYFLLNSDSLRKSDKIYNRLLNRLISQYKKPKNRQDSKTYSFAEWDYKGINIWIEAKYREISVTYAPLHKGQSTP
jgi:hypothetical protein